MAFDLGRILRSSPEAVGGGKLPPRAWFFHFSDEAEARRGGEGTLRLLLDGEWEFRFFSSPDEVNGDHLPGAAGAWEKITVPGCWDMQGYGHPHYTNIVMPFDELPPDPPKKNPTGVYRRNFRIPEEWLDRRLVLRFDGVENFFAVFLNGEAVGFSKDSRGASEFDLSGRVHAGENLLSVVVSQFSDASYVEDQDQWWHAGIVRSVSLHAMPKNHIEDFFAAATLDESLRTGLLDLELIAGLDVAGGLSGKSDGMTEVGAAEPQEGWFFRVRLYDDAGREVLASESAVAARKGFKGYFNLKDPRRFYSRLRLELPGARHWSAEDPFLYRLTVTLCHRERGEVDFSGCRVGFRRVEVAHRELRINGKPVLICGVNRHEHDPHTGRTLTLETMRRDVELMKRFNVNAVRTSHYPDAPEFYELCDEYGLYVFDEANIENHAFFYDLCMNPAWAFPYMDRAIHLVTRDRNHPSVIVWSLGNESGIGPNHAAAAAWIRRVDPSRVFLCERAIYSQEGGWLPNLNRELTDIIAPMYPDVRTIVNWASYPTDDERPMILCEFSHAMGNSNGCLADYFAAFRRCHGLQGGFIWEWIDHGIARKDDSGREYWVYGGDFGDEPNDSNFVTDGLVFPDRTPHPGLYEFKKLAQPAEFRAVDPASGLIAIVNRRCFTDLSDCELEWEVTVDGRSVAAGKAALPPHGPEHFIPDFAGAERHDIFNEEPHNIFEVKLPVREPAGLRAGEECFLNLRLVLRAANRWAQAGHVVASEQFALPFRSFAAPSPLAGLPAELTFDDGGRFSLACRGVTLIERGPVLNVIRATTDNDCIRREFGRPEFPWRPANRWLQAGYFDFRRNSCESRAIPGGRETVSSYATPGGKRIRFSERVRVTVGNWIEVDNRFAVGVGIDDLPRLGVELELPGLFETVEYFGRGPHENYIDRCAAAEVGLYRTTIDAMHVPYIMPQENGHRTGVRRLKLGGAKLRFALEFIAPVPMEFSVGRYPIGELQTKRHEHELCDSGKVWLHLDLRQRGVGTASCGPDTLPQYRIPAGDYHFRYLLRVTEA